MTTHRTTGFMAPVDRYAVPVMFNPYTGEPRDVRDVQSDPQGILIIPPGKVEMLATKLAQAAQPVQPGWLDIASAPKDGTRVLIVNGDGDMDVAGYSAEFQERSEYVRTAKDGDVFRSVREDVGYWDTDRANRPSHWMPLPPPPIHDTKEQA